MEPKFKECPECGLTFKRNGQLMRHAYAAHEIVVPPRWRDKPEKPRVNPSRPVMDPKNHNKVTPKRAAARRRERDALLQGMSGLR